MIQKVEIPQHVRTYLVYVVNIVAVDGSLRRQGINGHDIDLVNRDNSVLAC